MGGTALLSSRSVAVGCANVPAVFEPKRPMGLRCRFATEVFDRVIDSSVAGCSMCPRKPRGTGCFLARNPCGSRPNTRCRAAKQSIGSGVDRCDGPLQT